MIPIVLTETAKLMLQAVNATSNGEWVSRNVLVEYTGIKRIQPDHREALDTLVANGLIEGRVKDFQWEYRSISQ